MGCAQIIPQYVADFADRSSWDGAGTWMKNGAGSTMIIASRSPRIGLLFGAVSSLDASGANWGCGRSKVRERGCGLVSLRCAECVYFFFIL